MTESEISYKVRKTCKEASIAQFKAAYFSGDLSGLIIEGTPDPDDLQSAWEDILFEFSALIKNEDSQYLFELQQQISLLKLHISQVDYAVYFLVALYEKESSCDMEVLKGLTDLGYDVEFTPEDPKKYVDSLIRVKSICKTNVFDLEGLVKDYDRLAKTTEGKKQTEEEFDANIAMLSKYQHYPIDEEKVNVYKFTVIFNNYLREMKLRSKTPTTSDAE